MHLRAVCQCKCACLHLNLADMINGNLKFWQIMNTWASHTGFLWNKQCPLSDRDTANHFNTAYVYYYSLSTLHIKFNS